MSTTLTADVEPTAPAARGSVVGRWWPAAYGTACGLACGALVRRAIPDDGLISMALARNLAEHGQWAITTDVESNAATSPLNVWLLAGLHLLAGGRATVAVALLMCACLALVAMWLRELGGPFAAVAGPVLLVGSPVLASSFGLETFLAATVLVGVVRYGRDARVVATGLLLGAAAVTRPDVAVAAGAAVLALAVARPALWRAVPLAACVAAPWAVWSWWRFGSVWPDTVAVKSSMGGWGPDGTVGLAEAGPIFLRMWPVATVLTVLVLAVGVVALAVAGVRRDRAAVALGLAGLVDLAVMAATAAAPAYYYLGPAVSGLGLCAVLTASRASWPGRAPVVVVVAGAAVFVATWPTWSEGVAPLRQNFATSGEYGRMVADLPTDGAILSTNEIGGLAFYCQDRGCTVVDPYLSDPGRSATFVQQWRAEHPMLAWNFARYSPPAPLPVRYRLSFSYDEPRRPGDWTITGANGRTGIARLSVLR